MAYFNGTTGDCTFSGTALEITDWSFTSESSELETTNVGDAGFYNAIAGKRKGSGTAKAFYQDTLHGATPIILKDGTTATLTLHVSSGGQNISGSATIYNVNYDHSFDSVFAVDFDFSFNGAYKLPGEP